MDEEPHRLFWSPLGSGKVPLIVAPNAPQENERCLPLEDLLPGISNEVTLDAIASKMCWKSFHVLSSVSRAWRHAIRSRQVYDARVRSQTTETLALVHCILEFDKHEIALYSLQDGSCYLLPPIPCLRNGGIPAWCQCVSVDGKVYVLGGCSRSSSGGYSDVRTVYVLDLAGQRQWKQCASMREGRYDFGCGVINGKIYVFGGFTGQGDHCRQSDVYDPKKNTWSTVRPMMKQCSSPVVAVLREELLLHNGIVWHGSGGKAAEFLVYHPIRDEWREVESFGRPKEKIFMAQGKFHSMDDTGLHIHDADKNSWGLLHTHLLAYPFNNLSNSTLSSPFNVVAMEDKLLALVFWYDATKKGKLISLVQSTGFGGRRKAILWKKAPVQLRFTDNYPNKPPFISLIQL